MLGPESRSRSESSLLRPPLSSLATASFGSAAAFATGIGCARAFSTPWMFAAVVALAGAAGWSLSIFVLERSRLSSPFLRAGMLMFLWAGAGAFLERRCHEFFVSSPLLTSLEIAARAVDHFPIPLRGWVVDDPVTLRDRRQLLFRVEEAWWGGRWRPCPGTVRVSLREEGPPLPVRFGDRLEMSVRLRHPRNFRNPGAFDYHRYLEGDGIHLLGSVKTTRLVRTLPGKRARGEIPAHRLRARLLRRGPGESLLVLCVHLTLKNLPN